jgi:O-methyltransferase
MFRSRSRLDEFEIIVQLQIPSSVDQPKQSADANTDPVRVIRASGGAKGEAKKTMCHRQTRMTEFALKEAYLNLLKRTLLDDVYGSVDLRSTNKPTAEAIAAGSYWPGRAHTMIGERRLDNIRQCVESVLSAQVPGDLLEAGVWRGGATIFMRGVLKAHGVTDRKVWAADSFQGLPPPDPRYPADEGATFHELSFLAVPAQEVEQNFRSYGLWDDQVMLLPGFFEDSLPAAPIERLAVLRLDGDMYSSTIHVLNTLYDKLSIGGFVIIDDYKIKSCRGAVHDFRNARGISAPMILIDPINAAHPSVYWQKT